MLLRETRRSFKRAIDYSAVSFDFDTCNQVYTEMHMHLVLLYKLVTTD